MPEVRSDAHSTLALSTKVEEDFVAPLTAVRGALEILRDVDELSEEDRQRFVATALRSCARLEKSVAELADTVYAAGQQALPDGAAPVSPERQAYAGRIQVLEDLDTIEVDFSDFVFSNSAIVNDFHDVIDETVEESGRNWFFLVNYRGCSIWPEAWVAFAHRGKKINVSYSLGTVRYSDGDDRDDPEIAPSREAALAQIEQMRTA